MKKLIFSSCQAPNADFLIRDLADYVGRRLHIPTQFVNDIPWPERERRLDAGEIDICWICGLPYVLKADRPEAVIELLAAPVMAGARYQDRPVYFSDVVVHRDSPFRRFADLRGASWAYNEPGSQSGYNITRYHLATLGEMAGYFGRVVESGGHEISLQLLLRREIEASAVDSTVLETAVTENPALSQHLRIIDALGPSPIPPLVVGRHVPVDLRQAVHDLLAAMADEEDGRSLLSRARLARFASVRDADYDPIREMARMAQTVRQFGQFPPDVLNA